MIHPKLEVPFEKEACVTGESFADDKRYMAGSHEGMENRFRMAEEFNHFCELEMKPEKCKVQALVYREG